MLEAAIEAALGGHDLGEWLPVSVDSPAPGWEAYCKPCGASVWVGRQGLQYSLFADTCPGSEPE